MGKHLNLVYDRGLIENKVVRENFQKIQNAFNEKIESIDTEITQVRYQPANISEEVINKIVLRVLSKGVEFTCEPEVEVGDFVFVNASGNLGRAKADRQETMPSVGYVIEKSGATIAYIKSDYLDTEFSGVVNREEYFISDSVAGSIQDSPPTTSNHIKQRVALGVGGGGLKIFIDPFNTTIIGA